MAGTVLAGVCVDTPLASVAIAYVALGVSQRGNVDLGHRLIFSGAYFSGHNFSCRIGVFVKYFVHLFLWGLFLWGESWALQLVTDRS